MSVLAKPSTLYSIPGNPFISTGCKLLLGVTEGTGVPANLIGSGAGTLQDGTGVAGTTDPTWTTDALSSPSSAILRFIGTDRQISYAAPGGTSQTAWNYWVTFKPTSAARTVDLFVQDISNANSFRIRYQDVGSSRFSLGAVLWQNYRVAYNPVDINNWYTLLVTLKYNGSGDQDLDFYLWNHTTDALVSAGSGATHFDLVHGSIPQSASNPVHFNSRVPTNANVGFVGDLWTAGYSSNASGTVITSEQFLAFVSDPLSPARAALSATPTNLTPSTNGQAVSLTGNTATWTAGTPGTPTFSLTADNATLVSQVVGSTTGATVTLNTGAAETVTITDGGTGASVDVTVSASSATTLTLTAPSPATGIVGAASGNFTITIDGVPTPDPLTITFSDGGDGGTFSPVSTTFTGSVFSRTFTYTPASSGTKTITISNGGSYDNPAAVEYIATTTGIQGGSITHGTPTRSAVNLSSSIAASGGSGALTYSWEVATTSAGSYSTISGQTSAGLVSYSTPYNVTKWYRRRVTDSATPTANTAVSNTLAASALPIETVGILFIGSSTTQLLSTSDIVANMEYQVSGLYTDVVGTNQGVSGTQSTDWLPADHPNNSGTRLATALSNASSALSAATLKVVSLMISVNDARLSNRSAADVATYNLAIANHCLANGYDLVVIQGPNFFIVPTAGTNAQLDLVKGYLTTLKALDNGANILAGQFSWFNFLANNQSLISNSDGIHATSTGNNLLERLLADSLSGALERFRSPVTASTTGPTGPSVGSPFIRSL